MPAQMVVLIDESGSMAKARAIKDGSNALKELHVMSAGFSCA
jgi:hypothetical protein